MMIFPFRNSRFNYLRLEWTTIVHYWSRNIWKCFTQTLANADALFHTFKQVGWLRRPSSCGGLSYTHWINDLTFVTLLHDANPMRHMLFLLHSSIRFAFVFPLYLCMCVSTHPMILYGQNWKLYTPPHNCREVAPGMRGQYIYIYSIVEKGSRTIIRSGLRTQVKFINDRAMRESYRCGESNEAWETISFA